MGFQVFGTAHLGEARCICSTNPKGCPLHQHVETIISADDSVSGASTDM